MIGWLQNLDDDARRISLNQASLNSGINAKAIVKVAFLQITGLS